MTRRIEKSVQVIVFANWDLKVEVVCELIDKFLYHDFVIVDQARKGARRGTTVGASFVTVANLLAIIATVLLGEDVANVSASRREIVR